MKDYDSDPIKQSSNVDDHQVKFRYAIRALSDPNRIRYYDKKNSGYNKYGIFERRYCVIGKCPGGNQSEDVEKRTGRILFISYTFRDGKIRLISA